jgi:hypothetical protein
LTPLPEPGPVDLPFFVHGVRYLSEAERAHLDRLVPEQPLKLEYEETNPKNARAVLVSSDGTKLGYVPDPLIEVIRSVMKKDHGLKVVRVNDPEAGLHQRLLVRLWGTLEALARDPALPTAGHRSDDQRPGSGREHRPQVPAAGRVTGSIAHAGEATRPPWPRAPLPPADPRR